MSEKIRKKNLICITNISFIIDITIAMNRNYRFMIHEEREDDHGKIQTLSFKYLERSDSAQIYRSKEEHLGRYREEIQASIERILIELPLRYL